MIDLRLQRPINLTLLILRAWVAITCFSGFLTEAPARTGAGEAQSGAADARRPNRQAVFHLYDNVLVRNNQDWVSSLPAQYGGVVIDAWQADTAANRRACHSTWLFDHAHERLCANLNKHRIVALEVVAASPSFVVYVPALQTDRIAVGDLVQVQRASMRPDGHVLALPRILETHTSFVQQTAGQPAAQINPTGDMGHH